MDKRNSLVYILLILILSIPAIGSILKPDFFSSHDGVIGVAKFAKFYQNFLEGQLIPRWTGDAAYGLGTPVLMFYGQLPHYLATIPKILGASFTSSVEIIFAMSVIFSGFFFYLWLREVFGSIPAFLGAVFYIWAPYRFIDIYVRGAFPESAAFVFPPLMMLSGLKVINKFTFSWFLMGVLSISGLILTHNVMALIFSAVFILYGLILSFPKKFANFKYIIVIFLAAVFLSAYFWIPAYFEKQYTYLDKLNASGSHLTNFSSIKQIIYSKWNWGSLRSDNPMSPQLGIGQWIVFIIVIFITLSLIFRDKFGKIKEYISPIEKEIKLQYVFFFLLVPISLFLMTEYSLFLWNSISLLSFFLYPWRFLALAIFSCAFLASFVVYMSKNNLLVIMFLLLIVLYSNRNYTQIGGVVRDNDHFFSNYTGTMDMWGEFLPKGADLDMVWSCKFKSCNFSKVEFPQEVIYTITTNKHNELSVNYFSKEDFKGVINSYNFPGWGVTLDGKEQDFKTNSEGVIEVLLPKGEHVVATKFGDTLLRLVSLFISLTSILSLIYLGWRRRCLSLFI